MGDGSRIRAGGENRPIRIGGESRRIRIVVMLFLLCAINYVDRVALSVAAAPVAQTFHISTVEMGYLFSSFIWTYIICLLPWGLLVDRLGTRRVNALGMTIWSLATIATGLSWNFGSLFATRLVMGAGESSTYPAGGRVIREWIPAGERGLATAAFNSGGYAGPAFGALFMAALVGAVGWRGGFVAAGAVGFVWLAAWLIWFRPPEQAAFLGEAERAHILRSRDLAGHGPAGPSGGLPALLRSRSMWALWVVQGCAVYTQYLFLTWLPSYLQAAKHLTIARSGLYTALPYLIAMGLSMVLGRISDRLLSHEGVRSGRRRGMVAATMLVSAVVLATPFVGNIWVILGLTTVSLSGISATVAMNIALLNDLVRNAGDIGRANALLVTGGNTFGLLAPIVTGYVIAGTGSYNGAFVIAGLLLIAGATVCLTLTRRPIATAPLAGLAPAG